MKHTGKITEIHFSDQPEVEQHNGYGTCSITIVTRLHVDAVKRLTESLILKKFVEIEDEP